LKPGSLIFDLPCRTFGAPTPSLTIKTTSLSHGPYTTSLFRSARLTPLPRLCPIYGLQLPRLLPTVDAWPSASSANASYRDLPRLQTLSPTAVSADLNGSLRAPKLQVCKGSYTALSSTSRPTSLPSVSWGYIRDHVDRHQRLLGPIRLTTWIAISV
jgi:hypothetical protein